MTAQYRRTSPYFDTGRVGLFLDVMVNRNITSQVNDVYYRIDKVYEHRPDLLANDLYGDSGLWWVFAQRNPDVIQDPIWDFRAGRSIFIPSKDQLTEDLGL